jgi:type IV pilus assembly protein PilM
MAPFVSALGQQIERSIHFFRSSQPQFKPNRLFFAGGCGSLPGIAEYFASAEHLQGIMVDPFLGMSISPRANRANLTLDAPALLTATGLALRGFE